MARDEVGAAGHRPARAPLTCSTVTFRHDDLARALDVIAGLGFTTADLGALAGLCEHVPPRGSVRELAVVARVVRASGVAPTSVNADPGSFNGVEDAGAVLDRIARLLDACAEMGSPRLVLPCGEPADPARPVGDQVAAVADGLARAAELAADRSVELVVEAPHLLRLADDLDRTRELLRRLDPTVRHAWDVSHVRAAGEDPAAAFAEFAARVSIVHLRDAVPGDIRRAIGRGDIDFGAVRDALRAAGSTAPVVLELETHDSPFATKEEEVASALQQLSTWSEDPR